MGKNDDYNHYFHTSKRIKFNAVKPEQRFLSQHNVAPQMPPRKTNSSNRYLGRGRGQS